MPEKLLLPFFFFFKKRTHGIYLLTHTTETEPPDLGALEVEAPNNKIKV